MPGATLFDKIWDEHLVRSEPGAADRNFEGRQGRGGRPHLVSPAMAAAAAVHQAATAVLRRDRQKTRITNGFDFGALLPGLTPPLAAGGE